MASRNPKRKIKAAPKGCARERAQLATIRAMLKKREWNADLMQDLHDVVNPRKYGR